MAIKTARLRADGRLVGSAGEAKLEAVMTV